MKRIVYGVAIAMVVIKLEELMIEGVSIGVEKYYKHKEAKCKEKDDNIDKVCVIKVYEKELN